MSRTLETCYAVALLCATLSTSLPAEATASGIETGTIMRLDAPAEPSSVGLLVPLSDGSPAQKTGFDLVLEDVGWTRETGAATEVIQTIRTGQSLHPLAIFEVVGAPVQGNFMEIFVDGTRFCGVSSTATVNPGRYFLACSGQVNVASASITLRGIADRLNQFQETDETNNVVERTYVPLASQGLDLVATDVRLRTESADGGNVVQTLQQGDAAHLHGYFSIVGDSVSGQFAALRLNGQSVCTLSASSPLPPGNYVGWCPSALVFDQAGQQTISLVMDPANQFQETNETNNTITRNIQVTAAGGNLLGPEYSGAWYWPARDGEGFFIEMLAGDRALVYWFTYPPAGSSHRQTWIIGVGTVSGNAITVEDAVITRGARFGDAFDPDDVVREVWGRMRFEFDDCNHGQMTYQAGAGFGSGGMPVQRLAALKGAGCTPSQADQRGFLSGGHSGSWYNPERDGEGLIVQILGELALVSWFTYDGEGNQAWNLNVGQVRGNTILVRDSVEPTGTNFGDAFDSNDIERPVFGSMSITFDDCNSGSLLGTSGTGLGMVFTPLVRLTSIDGLDCEHRSPYLVSNALITNPADDSLILQTDNVDGSSISFIGERDLATGLTTSADVISVTDEHNSTTLIQLQNDGRPDRFVNEDDGDLAVNWLDDTRAVLTISLPGEVFEASVLFDFAALETGQDPARVISIKGLGLDLPPVETDKQGSRRNPLQASQIADLSISTNTACDLDPLGEALLLEKVGSTPVVISVSACGSAVDDVLVRAELVPPPPGLIRQWPAKHQGNGIYMAQLPTRDRSEVFTNVSRACVNAVQTFGQGCDVFGPGVNALLVAAKVGVVCAKVTGSVIQAAGLTGLAAAPKVATACTTALTAYAGYCATLGASPGPGGTSVAEYACPQIAHVDRLVDYFQDSDVRIGASVKPGGLPWVGQGPVTASVFGPYPSFDFDLGGDRVELTSLTIAPAAPAANQSYVARADLNCVPANTPVVISVSGTDGYNNQVNCTVSGSGTCSISVPGAAEGVRDEISVRANGVLIGQRVLVFGG